jgi:phage repressor protein C with HTH and peptisase S24 domain
MNHSDIWGAIERFAASLRLTCSGLARFSGLDPTTFNRSKRFSKLGQPRWPSTQSIAKILAATNHSIEEFVKFLAK